MRMSSSAFAGKESSISVTVRVRPFTNDEAAQITPVQEGTAFLGDGSLATSSTPRPGKRGLRKIINVVDDRMLVFDPPENNPLTRVKSSVLQKTNVKRAREYRFCFDKLFDESTSQEEVYSNTTRPLLSHILDGFNATVFAYGATGCGKTHTISGTKEQPGIIFLTMEELFSRIDSISDEFIVEVSLSYLEIYNETIRDLLNPEGNNKPLVLREDADQKISVSGLSSHKPQSVQEVMDMIIKGNQLRTMSPTEANATSSRSHAVLQINITKKSRTANVQEAHTFATLSIIDLAGSERASATRNRGERLLEGANINKSLLALGNCINALCDPRRRNHVPYRDSKLTRLLKFSLGGNCMTVMIVCVSPSSKHYDETLNTLKYADRAKKIKTKVTRNEHNLDRHVGSYLKMITELRSEIEELRGREDHAVQTAKKRIQGLFDERQNALDDAIQTLKRIYDSTFETRATVTRCIARLDTIEPLIAGLQGTLQSMNNLIAESPALRNLSYFSDFANNAKGRLDQLCQERELLQQNINNGGPHVLSNSLKSELRKASSNSGWTDNESKLIAAYSELLLSKYESDILRAAREQQNSKGGIKDSIVHNNLSLVKLLLDNLSRVSKLRSVDVEVLPGEISLTLEESTKECTQKMGALFLDDMECEPVQLDFSNLPQGRTSFVDLPMNVATSSPMKGVFDGTTRGTSPRRSPRRSSSLKRSSAAHRSPRLRKRGIERKKLKRVRWEDDRMGASPITRPIVNEEGSRFSDFKTLDSVPVSGSFAPIPEEQVKSGFPLTNHIESNIEHGRDMMSIVKDDSAISPIESDSLREDGDADHKMSPPSRHSKVGVRVELKAPAVPANAMRKPRSSTISSSSEDLRNEKENNEGSSDSSNNGSKNGGVSPMRRRSLAGGSVPAARVTVPTAASSMRPNGDISKPAPWR